MARFLRANVTQPVRVNRSLFITSPRYILLYVTRYPFNNVCFFVSRRDLTTCMRACGIQIHVYYMYFLVIDGGFQMFFERGRCEVHLKWKPLCNSCRLQKFVIVRRICNLHTISFAIFDRS